MTFQIK